MANQEAQRVAASELRQFVELFQRLISRAQPLRKDSPLNFNAWKERVDGAFMAGGVQMGWAKK